MCRRAADWRGWPLAAAVGAAALAVFTLRHGIAPHSDGVSYWSAANESARGHLTSSGLIPAFSDLDVRAIAVDARAPFVDFPLGYPWLLALLSLAVGVTGAQLVTATFAVAATAWLVVRGPTPATTPAALGTRACMAFLIISVPIAVEARQGGLPEPLFVAGLVWFCFAVFRLRSAEPAHPRATRALLTLALIGAALGLLRFVGMPLVVVVVVEGLRRRVPLRWVVTSAAVCAGPGALNAMWAASVTSRSPHLMSRDMIDFDWGATSLSGWFTSWHTKLSDILVYDWRVPTVLFIIGSFSLLLVVVGSVWWLVRGNRAPAAAVPLAVAGGLLGSVLVTMFVYDGLTKFEPRMMYPPGALVALAYAWFPPRRVPHQAAFVGALVWVLSAAGPWHWSAPRFATDLERARVLEATGVDFVVTDAADPLHYQTGIPAVYLPTTLKIHSGKPRERELILEQIPCLIARGNGAVLIDPVGNNDPEAVATLDEATAEGRLRRIEQPEYVLYLPTPEACAVG